MTDQQVRTSACAGVCDSATMVHCVLACWCDRVCDRCELVMLRLPKLLACCAPIRTHHKPLPRSLCHANLSTQPPPPLLSPQNHNPHVHRCGTSGVSWISMCLASMRPGPSRRLARLALTTCCWGPSRGQGMRHPQLSRPRPCLQSCLAEMCWYVHQAAARSCAICVCDTLLVFLAVRP
mgnify:CR=1 FL=1